MKEKIIIALRRKYHCDHARLILKQSALSYPVYELDETQIRLMYFIGPSPRERKYLLPATFMPNLL